MAAAHKAWQRPTMEARFPDSLNMDIVIELGLWAFFFGRVLEESLQAKEGLVARRRLGTSQDR